MLDCPKQHNLLRLLEQRPDLTVVCRLWLSSVLIPVQSGSESAIFMAVLLHDSGTKLQACSQGGEVRHCQKCCKPKPPRTHHCKVCKRCVLRCG